MRKQIFAPILVVSLGNSSGVAQQSAPTVSSYLQSSLNAMVGQATILDATLTGTAQVTASSDQSVPAVLEETSAGSASIAISLPSGTSTDVRIGGAVAPSGTWSNGDGTTHAISSHNLMTDPGWFFPEMVVSRLISNTSLSVAFVGQEGNLLHFQAYQPQPDSTASTGALLQHLTQMDIYLDSTTLLPAQLNFNIHPDGNAIIDIPVSVQYSNYQTVNGVVLPMRVQKYLNNNIALDIQIQTAVFNSGLTISAPSAQ